MKLRPNKNQLTWGVTAFLVFLAAFVVYYLIFHAGQFTGGLHKIGRTMMPITFGIIIAFIMTPVLNFVEGRWLVPLFVRRGRDVTGPSFTKDRRRMRSLSVLITMCFLLLCLYALTMIVVPQLLASLNQFFTQVPAYVDNVNTWISRLPGNQPMLRKWLNAAWNTSSAQLTKLIKTRVLPNMGTILQTLTTQLVGAVRVFFNLIVGLIVAIYLLASKETFCAQGKKIAYALFRPNTANEVVGAFRFINATFNGFISGKIIDSAIIGVLCFLGASIIGTPYPVLVSVIVGVTNIIPFFGPYIGAIIGGVLILLIQPLQALYFVIFVIILQQFDGNVLGPKILGDSTGLSSFWVIFAIMIFGGLFGVLGWVIGVPLFAVIYAFARRVINHFLKKRRLPTDTADYYDAAYLEGGELKSRRDPANTRFRAQPGNTRWRRLFRRRPTAPDDDKNDAKDETSEK